LDDQAAALGPELGELVMRVHNVTQVPVLTSQQYGAIFKTLAEQLSVGPYQLTQTSRAVRDRCLELGEPIARQAVSFVLKGIAYRKGFASTVHNDEATLAHVFAENVLGSISAAQLELTDDERRRVALWITSGSSGPDTSI
jgi:hypothetical protein